MHPNLQFIAQSNYWLLNDPRVIYYHAARPSSLELAINNAVRNFCLFPKAYVYVVSAPIPTNRNATVIPPKTPERQDTAKADKTAKAEFSKVHKANNSLKDFIDTMSAELPQFEKSPNIYAAVKKLVSEAECLVTQLPKDHDHGAVEAFITVIDLLKNEFVELQKQIKEFEIRHAKNLKEVLETINGAKNALQGTFDIMEKDYGAYEGLRDILNSRKGFWVRHEKLTASTNDFKAFNAETQMHIVYDFFLLSLVEDEIVKAKSKETPIQSNLGILCSMAKEDADFEQSVNSALKKFKMTSLTAQQVSEIQAAITDILLEIEREAIATFINSLKAVQEEFASDGYMTVAEHYNEAIGKFEDIAKKLCFETIDTYISEWNAFLKEFDAEHQDLMKLKEAEKALQKITEEAREWFARTADSKCYEAFIKLNQLGEFRYKKSELKNADDIDAYINTIYSFIDEVKKQIK